MGDKIILGFIGPIASGKGTACKYLVEKHNAGYVRFSTVLRDILDRVHLPHSRENMQLLSTTLRGQFGDDLLALAIAKDAQADAHDIVGVDGVRRAPDIKHLLQVKGFHLISIDAHIKVRFERLVQRGENPDDHTKTFEVFVEDNKRETELQIADLQKTAEFQIDNDGSFEDLYKQIDEILSKLQAPLE